MRTLAETGNSASPTHADTTYASAERGAEFMKSGNISDRSNYITSRQTLPAPAEKNNIVLQNRREIAFRESWI